MADTKAPAPILSTLFPKLHPTNLKQLSAAIRFAGDKSVWFHGDGNIYFAKHLSEDRLIFHNDHPDNYGAGFRKEFNKTTPVPADLKAMESQLVEAMNQEKKDKAATNSSRNSSNPNAIPSSFEEEPAKEVSAPSPAPAKAKADDTKADDTKK